MLRICHSRLANGRRCQCAANRNQDFCRHHTPEALRLRDSARSGELVEQDIPIHPRREWPLLAAWIMASEAEAFEDLLENLMTSMAEGVMSHRTAGRLLLLLYRRREELRHPNPLRRPPSPVARPVAAPAVSLANLDAITRRGEAQLAQLEEALREEAHGK